MITIDLQTSKEAPIKPYLSLLAALPLLLFGCGPVDSLKEGFAHSQAVAADLEKSLGVKSFVGFNWNNGSLTSVNVTFQGIPPNVPLAEIAAKSKAAVTSQFKQTPKQVVVSFVIEP